jgi:hypothetical protein
MSYAHVHQEILEVCFSALYHDFALVRYVFQNSMHEKLSMFKSNLSYCCENLGLDINSISLKSVSAGISQVTHCCSVSCSTTEEKATAKAIRELTLVRDGQASGASLSRTEAILLASYLCIH